MTHGHVLVAGSQKKITSGRKRGSILTVGYCLFMVNVRERFSCVQLSMANRLIGHVNRFLLLSSVSPG